MKIGIDARFLGPDSKGLGRYTQQLITHLEDIDHTNEYVIFLRSDNWDLYTPKNKNFTKVRADYQWYTLAEQLFLPRLIKKTQCDIVHFLHFNVPFFYRQKFLVTIHDLTLIHFPTIRGSTLSPLFYWIKYLAYKVIIKNAIERANTVIAVSHFTRKDILAHYPVDPQKVRVAHEAAIEKDTCSSAQEDDFAVIQHHGIMKPYILYVGNAYPHKNVEQLVLAYKEARKTLTDVQCVLVGKDDYFYQKIRMLLTEQGITGVTILHSIDDSLLTALYAHATAFVFPSLYEGFGLPPLEAMVHGVPVASSDHPCMREILGDAAYYFDATEPQNIAAAIVYICTDENLRTALTQKGPLQAKRYSWKRMAEEIYMVYGEV